MIYSADGAAVIDAHLTDMKKYVDQATNNAVRYIENSVSVVLPNTASSWESVCYGSGKFIAVAQARNNAYSEDGVNWTETTLPDSLFWSSVCHGNGKFVTVTYDSNVAAYSEDGINWTQTELPASEKWNSVCYGNGRFVAVADQSKVSAYSTDGINWTETTWNVGHDWSSVCYGNGKFVAVDSFNSNIAAYSTDGVNWTETTLPAKKNWSSVCYGNGKFIAVVEGSNIAAYSEDGISWTQTTLPANKDWISVCYGNGKFVVTTNGSNVAAYSTDGITWTQTTMPANKSWYSVCYGNGKFVAVDYNGAAAFSTDGITWLNTNTTRVFQNAAGEDISEDVKEAIGAATETYVDNAIAAIPTPDVSGQIATHNTANDAHQDIRNGLTGAVAVLNDHLANVLNPHGVTAEQVGARPDTWMPKMSDVAYLGENLIASTADDTTANWAGFGSGYVWYSAASHLIDQPSTYGFLVNYVYGSDIFQIWHSQNSGPMYTRSGNANGWSDSWKKHITTNDITYGTADLTAGSSALETGKLYFVYE